MMKGEQNDYLKNLDQALIRLGQTKTWLALKCNRSPSVIINLFARNSYPSINLAYEISQVLGYPMEEMLKGNVELFQPAAKSKRELIQGKIIFVLKSLNEDEIERIYPIIKDIIDFKRAV